MLSSGRFFGWKTKHQGPRLYPRTFHNQERRSEMDPRESFPRSALADRDLCRRRAPRPTPRLVYDRSLGRRTGESENASATGDAQRGIDPHLSAGQAHVKQRQLVRQTGDLVDDNEIAAPEYSPQIACAGAIEADPEHVDGVMRRGRHRLAARRGAASPVRRPGANDGEPGARGLVVALAEILKRKETD